MLNNYYVAITLLRIDLIFTGHGLTIHHHDSDILLCPSHARIFSNSLSTRLKHDYWIVEEYGEDEAKWVDTPIFICEPLSAPILHHPIITPAISHCDIPTYLSLHSHQHSLHAMSPSPSFLL